MFVPNRLVVVALLAVSSAACARTPSTEGSGSQASGTPPATPTTPTAGASAELRDTRWLLTTLGDKAITATDTGRAAHFILRGDSKQVSGSGGCNRLFGVYELNGDALRFSGIGSTKMACQDGMDTETAFLPALLRVAKYRIEGQQLELSDSTGAVIARFAAKAK
jgi:heat shock protein HslJ